MWEPDYDEQAKYWIEKDAASKKLGSEKLIEPFSEEYIKLLNYKKIPVEGMKKLPKAMNLIKVAPVSYDLLDSELKQEGVDSRQHWDV